MHRDAGFLGHQPGDEREVSVPQSQRAGERRADPRLVDVDRGVVAHHRLIGVGDVLLALELLVGQLEPGFEARSLQALVGLGDLGLESVQLVSRDLPLVSLDDLRPCLRTDLVVTYRVLSDHGSRTSLDSEARPNGLPHSTNTTVSNRHIRP